MMTTLIPIPPRFLHDIHQKVMITEILLDLVVATVVLHMSVHTHMQKYVSASYSVSGGAAVIQGPSTMMILSGSTLRWRKLMQAWHQAEQQNKIL